jgi:hypothetical protein
MKKFLMLNVLALALVAVSSQPASAWCKFNFGIGANIGWTTGGNCLLWGAAKGQQPPPPCGPYGGPFYAPAVPFDGGYHHVSHDNSAVMGGNFEADTPAPIQRVEYGYPYGGYGYQPMTYYPTSFYGYDE